MQRMNTPVPITLGGGLSNHYGVLFDGIYYYVCYAENKVRKVHKDDGLVATIDLSGRNSKPTGIDAIFLNSDNNIVGYHYVDSCAFCLSNSGTLEGTVVPATDDFVWIVDANIDEAFQIDGETLYQCPLGLINALTGEVLDDSGAYYIRQQAAHCNITGIYGIDSTSAMYVQNIRRIDPSTLSLDWESSCSGCWYVTMGYDGYIYAHYDSEWGPGTIYKFNPATGDNLKSIDISNDINEASSMLIDKGGNIYILGDDSNASSFYKFNNDGNKIFTKSTSSGLDLLGAV